MASFVASFNRRSRPLRSLIVIALGFLSVNCNLGYLEEPEVDCRRAGTCECQIERDCPEPLSCVNGFCELYPPTAVLGFGEFCFQDAECSSGYCISHASGQRRVCTRSCDLETPCPQEWDCKRRPDEPTVDLCVEHLERLCAECSVDAHCNPAFGDRCLELDGVFGCGLDCALEGACPEGYQCQALEVGGATVQQCVPDGGSCACTPANAGLIRACSRTNENGSCHGQQVCDPTGEWGPCESLEPQPEVCDGIDNDCDGLIDADDPSADISGLPIDLPYPRCQKGSAPNCRGTWTCQDQGGGAFDWSCGATDPEDEVCDGLDNDCDGQTDEDFLDPTGRYLHPEHCGTCELDCFGILQNLVPDRADAADCVVRGGSPTCVPRACQQGFAPYPELEPILCRENATPQCRPCTSAGDCVFSVDRCSPVGDDSHDSCLQGCGTDAPYDGCTGRLGEQGCCPDDHSCRNVAGAPVCLPDAGSCDCNPDRLDAARPCILENGLGQVCLGEQLCGSDATGSPEWSTCDASLTSLEVCDGVDNDCDGAIDNPFIDTQGTGTYDTDDHCGQCYESCSSRWSPTIQHAIGGCVSPGPNSAPACEIVACTQEQVGGGGACRLDDDCAAGWTCDPIQRLCSRPCTGPGDCPGGLCQDETCTVSCNDDPTCVAAFGEPSTCLGGTCQVEVQFVDADETDANGCECATAIGIGTDEPDVHDAYPVAGSPFIDRDCDGVDGEVSTALFVWSGTAQSLGTREAPFSSIGEALAAYTPGQHTQILVAAGFYEETIELSAGIAIHGGYSADFQSRDPVLHPTIVAGPEPEFATPGYPRGVVNAVGITSARTAFVGFVIIGFDVAFKPGAGQPGKNSYAVYLENSSEAVEIRNNVIVGGLAGVGGAGVAARSGASGGDGGAGRVSVECVTASCAGESQPGGAAGQNAACSSTAGNPGGRSAGNANPQEYRSNLGGNGLGGDNGTYSSQFAPQFAHLCKYDCMVGTDMLGKPAGSGQNGSDGSGGNACGNDQGSVSTGEWQPATASPGGPGGVATGGGGGGAGGCIINQNPSSCTVGSRVGDLGGTGGGGGAGGCGGAGGRPGGSGGGSFGVFVTYTQSVGTRPLVQGNILRIGKGGGGGAGGFGGHGGLGGPGGIGGIAQPPAWCAGSGGKGGRGGDGGNGGGGGGGCGGVAYGIAGVRIDAAGYEPDNSFDPPIPPPAGGPAGLGGPGPGGGGDGGTGATGHSDNFWAF